MQQSWKASSASGIFAGGITRQLGTGLLGFEYHRKEIMHLTHTVEPDQKQAEAIQNRRISLWKLVLRAVMVTLLSFWAIRAKEKLCVAAMPWMYDFHFHAVAKPQDDSRLIAWGVQQKEVDRFEVFRNNDDLTIRAYSHQHVQEFPIPLTGLARALTHTGYAGTGNRYDTDLTPYGQVLNQALTDCILLLTGFAGLYMAKRRGEPLPELFKTQARSATIPGLVGGLTIIAVGKAASIIFKTHYGANPLLGFPLPASAALYVLAIVGAGVCEEVLYRGYLLGSFLGARRIAPGLATTAFLFARAHDWGTQELTRIFVVGIVLGWLYASKKTLVAPIIAHMINNAVVYHKYLSVLA